MTGITQYNEQDVHELREILANLPFTAGVAPGVERITEDGRVNLPLLNSFLRTVSDKIAGYVERADAATVERDRLVSQRSAVRDFLGTNVSTYSIIAGNKQVE